MLQVSGLFVKDRKYGDSGYYTDKYKGYAITDTGILMVVIMMGIRHGTLP